MKAQLPKNTETYLKSYKGIDIEISHASSEIIKFWVANWRLTDDLKVIIWLQHSVVQACKQYNNNEFLQDILEHEWREAKYALDKAEQDMIDNDLTYGPTHDTIAHQLAYANNTWAHNKVVKEMHGSSNRHKEWSKKQLQDMGLQ